ncbi:RAM signaling pathway protein [Rhizoctonia solani 123E]|uniref:RAM signaling pathway protein n=1 Tax=Rhizoctonia solani 123E TaxID=1423351 RepID=A0A074SES1_9AGAM|nr:RAM signaling pathway protein [Rhizoctonia solani 123E]
MPSAGHSVSRPSHPRARSTSVPLDSTLIATAVASSNDAGKTLDFSLKNLADVGEDAAEELARIGRDDLDAEGTLTRLALSNNYLRKLPSKFASLYRLRYLNLRANAFVVFPDVVTKMPSLEILDIGRNKIQLLPADPGSLVNLRVFSLSKNRITKLPAYLVDFRSLKMLKVDSNPIEWPPASVVLDKIPLTDKTEDMAQFVAQLKQWYIANASPRKPSAEQSKRAPSSQANKLGESRAAHGRNVSEGSVNSEYSVTSEYSLVDNVNYAGGNTPALNISKTSKPARSESGGSPDTSVPALEETIPSSSSSYHGRNASYSADTRRPTASTGNLGSKQSLPDLRKGYTPNGTIKPSGRRPREPLAGSFSSSRQNGASTSAAGAIASPPLPTHPIHQGETSPPPGIVPETPMDGVRNSYFRRLSTIPLSVSAPPLPQSLVQTIDAIRGILFAVSQIYSAIQQYTNVIVDRRIANILVRVLDPAKRAMDTLIGALERYDSTVRRTVPGAMECRAVVEACHENVSVCCRVVAMLQLQLKVLAAGAGGDVRFARHLLLMLYGGVAEVVNSWRDLMPHLAEVKEFLAETTVPSLPPPTTSKSGLGLSMGPSTSGPSSSRRPISPIEEHTEPLYSTIARESESELEPAPTSAQSAPQPNHSRDLKLSTAGRVSSSSPMESPMSAGSDAPIAQSSPTPLRSALKNSNANGLHADRSAASSPNHSISGRSASRERNLADMTSSPLLRTSGRPVRRGPGALLATSDSFQGVDDDLLNTAEKAAAVASEMWALLGATIDSARSQGVGKGVIAPVDEGLSNALDATSKLRAALRAVREGAGKEAGRRPLYEFATLFAKSVTRAIVLLRNFSSSYPISPSLRGTAQRVTQATQETIFFLQASSFAPPPSARPTTPAFSGGLGLGVGDAGDGHLRAGFSLSRSRSAAVGGVAPVSSGPTPIPGTPRDVPWSAMPGQSFKNDEPMLMPSLIGRTGAQMI